MGACDQYGEHEPIGRKPEGRRRQNTVKWRQQNDRRQIHRTRDQIAPKRGAGMALAQTQGIGDETEAVQPIGESHDGKDPMIVVGDNAVAGENKQRLAAEKRRAQSEAGNDTRHRLRAGEIHPSRLRHVSAPDRGGQPRKDCGHVRRNQLQDDQTNLRNEHVAADDVERQHGANHHLVDTLQQRADRDRQRTGQQKPP